MNLADLKNFHYVLHQTVQRIAEAFAEEGIDELDLEISVRGDTDDKITITYECGGYMGDNTQRVSGGTLEFVINQYIERKAAKDAMPSEVCMRK